MRTRRIVLVVGLVAIVALALGVASTTTAAPDRAGDAAKGKYIFAASAGCGCHGPNLAGYKAGGPATLPASAPFGELFSGPFGSVPAANITPDKETGIGNWTDEQVIKAIRDGVSKDGRQLFPIMPYMNYHFMATGDVEDLVAYLRTVPAVLNKVPGRQLSGPVPPLPPLPPSPASAPASGVARGKYLAEAVAGCGDCHTPRSPEGAPDQTKLLAGSAMVLGPTEILVVPNITPDKSTGIGNWTEQQIVALLKTGSRPNGSKVGGLMAAVIGGGYSQLTDADAQAIAAYLKSIPAVNNVPQPPPASGEPQLTLPKTGMPVVSLALLAVAGVALAALGFALRRGRL